MATGFEALLTQQIVKRNIFQGMDQDRMFSGRGGGRSMRGACFLGKPNGSIFFFILPYEFRLTLDYREGVKTQHPFS